LHFRFKTKLNAELHLLLLNCKKLHLGLELNPNF
jgi:hypothetical protein